MTDDKAVMLLSLSAARGELRSVAREVIREELQPLLQKIRGSASKDGEVMTNADVMRYTGLSKSTLARYRRAEKLPYTRKGQRVYYKRSDVDAFFLGRQEQ